MAEHAPLRIGVLALQGAFKEHVASLDQLEGVQGSEVRKPEQLDGLDGLILPGGESTTMGALITRWNLIGPLRDWIAQGRPIWGTCAGLIMLANRVSGQKTDGQSLLGGLDVYVHRNYFGRQLRSFERDLDVAPGVLETADTAGAPAASSAHGVFIRAPAILETGPNAVQLAVVEAAPSPDAGLESTEPRHVTVAVRQGSMLGTAFHPELTPDLRWHALFARIVSEHRAERRPPARGA